MSNVFSAKRKKVEFEYEFLDGKKESLTARSLSSKEQENMSNIAIDNSSELITKIKKTIEKQLADNDKAVVKKVIRELYEEGDLIDFSNSLTMLIAKEKEKK